MHAQDGLADVGCVVHNIANHIGVFFRDGITNGIRQIDGGGTGFDGGFKNAAQVIAVAAGAVLGRKFDVVGERLGILYRIDSPLDDLVPGHFELVLEVNVGGGNKRVDAGFCGMLDGLPGAVDIGPRGPGQPGHLGFFQSAGDLGHSVQIAIGGRRKPGFQYIDPQFFQLNRQPELFGRVHAGAGRLFAIS